MGRRDKEQMGKEERKRKSKGHGVSTSTIAMIVVFLLGVAILLYPTVSNYINSINASHAIESYDDTVSKLDEANKEQMLADATSYNASLVGKGIQYVTGAPEDETYKSLLNVTDDGVMGYVTIKKLDVKLPIYHGTDDQVLASGVGHLEGSSLPVGGNGSHSVITGHRGLPSAKLFTDLDQLEVGDTFTVTTLGRVLTYQVDQIRIVLPEEINDLAIDSEQDYCTLVTCTPYAVNTHRLLVRGVRIDTPSDAYVPEDARRIDPVAVAPLVAAPVLLVLLVVLLRPKPKVTQNMEMKKDVGQDSPKERRR